MIQNVRFLSWGLHHEKQRTRKEKLIDRRMKLVASNSFFWYFVMIELNLFVLDHSLFDVIDRVCDFGISLCGFLLPRNLVDFDFDLVAVNSCPFDLVVYACHNLFFDWKNLVKLSPFVTLAIFFVDFPGLVHSLIDKIFLILTLEVIDVNVLPTSNFGSLLSSFLVSNIDVFLSEGCDKE